MPCLMFLSGLAPGGVYHARSVASSAVRSYRTFSPLPCIAGGLFSVALSLGSPPLDVIQHPDPVKPGLSSTGMPAAAIQPSVPARICAKIRQASQIRQIGHINLADIT